MTWRVAAVIALCLLSAFLDALSNVLQQHEAEQVPDEQALRPSLLFSLARRGRWLAGLGVDAGGYATYAAALAIGAVSFVQPIISVSIPISLLLGARLYHRQLLRFDMVAAFLLCAGVAMFLYETDPASGLSVAPFGRWMIAGPVCLAVFALCVGSARVVGAASRAALLGVAAGTSFAVGAVLTKSFVDYLGQGVFAWVPHWEPYAMAACSITGFLVVQSAFQTGSLGASVGGMGAAQPVVAVVLGVVLLDERVDIASPFHGVVVLLSLVAAITGILALARAEERSLGGGIDLRPLPTGP